MGCRFNTHPVSFKTGETCNPLTSVHGGGGGELSDKLFRRGVSIDAGEDQRRASGISGSSRLSDSVMVDKQPSTVFHLEAAEGNDGGESLETAQRVTEAMLHSGTMMAHLYTYVCICMNVCVCVCVCVCALTHDVHMLHSGGTTNVNNVVATSVMVGSHQATTTGEPYTHAVSFKTGDTSTAEPVYAMAQGPDVEYAMAQDSRGLGACSSSNVHYDEAQQREEGFGSLVIPWPAIPVFEVVRTI